MRPPVPSWIRPEGVPDHRLPSAQGLVRLRHGNERYVRKRRGEQLGPGDGRASDFPFAIVLGCADADAAPEAAFDERPGAIMSLRVAGPIAAEDVLATIEYAVDVLSIGVILVLGHLECRALTAAMLATNANAELPGRLNRLMSAAAHGSSRGDDPAAGHVRALVARLKAEQALLSAVRSGQVKVVGGVFDASNGTVKFLAETDPADTRDAVEDAATPRPSPVVYGS